MPRCRIPGWQRACPNRTFNEEKRLSHSVSGWAVVSGGGGSGDKGSGSGGMSEEGVRGLVLGLVRCINSDTLPPHTALALFPSSQESPLLPPWKATKIPEEFSFSALLLSVILVPLGGGRNRTVLRPQDREEKLILAAPEAASYWIRYQIGKRFAALFEIPNLANGRRTGGPTQEEHARPEIPCPELEAEISGGVAGGGNGNKIMVVVMTLVAKMAIKLQLRREAAHDECMVKAPEAKAGMYRTCLWVITTPSPITKGERHHRFACSSPDY
ncbi:hypothetical protein MUK42_18847 [Musa troglodytarum]|uniref:Uncharacterized protein n=1 Tax=Musa troglodytarum TaxID=320322 RepID=A0A9E7ENH1_9LILI|nr:hypothetical protein MUK42_18847 [Musa troglodytarum]